MIITRTPFRISFFGGGTDFPEFFNEHGGSVLSTTINHYCYITCRIMPPFFDYKYSLRYTNTERCKDLEDIQHNTIRESIRYLDFSYGIEVSHSGDIPANSGIGSSSSFCVGFLNALYGLRSKMMTRRQIAEQAIHIERNMVKEHVGFQDQIATAFGGFNRIDFYNNDRFNVTPMLIDQDKIEQLNNNLILIYSGHPRYSSDIIASLTTDKRKKMIVYEEMKKHVDTAVNILNSDNDINDFGRLLHESWMLKKTLGTQVSNPHLDDLYQEGLNAGALGGKICGAGGGGFFLFFVPEEKRAGFLQHFKKLLHVPFRFENYGSQVIFFTSGEPHLNRSY